MVYTDVANDIQRFAPPTNPVVDSFTETATFGNEGHTSQLTVSRDGVIQSFICNVNMHTSDGVGNLTISLLRNGQKVSAVTLNPPNLLGTSGIVFAPTLNFLTGTRCNRGELYLLSFSGSGLDLEYVFDISLEMLYQQD